MKQWLRPIRAAVRMGMLWAVVWVLIGFLIEAIHDVWPNPLGRMVDIWPAALGGPAFLGGFAFSMLLAIAGRRRRFGELSLPGFAALGAAGGALVVLVPAFMVLVGFASIKAPYTLWQVTASMMLPFAVVGAVSAAGSLALARRAEAREALASGENADEVGIAADQRLGSS